MPELTIGNRVCQLRRTTLKPFEASYVLRCSETDVRNMLRRGERLRTQGHDDESIIARGALPVELSAGRRRVPLAPLALKLHGDTLALTVLAALAEARTYAPRARRAHDPAPDLSASLAYI